MKPDWKDAPQWANWLAQDNDGVWNWFQNKPKKDGLIWSPSLGDYMEAQVRQNAWEKTIERRPEPE